MQITEKEVKEYKIDRDDLDKLLLKALDINSENCHSYLIKYQIEANSLYGALVTIEVKK